MILGMNAVIRAIVRFGLFKKFKVYLIFEGYNGLFKGEDFVKEANLSSVDHIIHKVFLLRFVFKLNINCESMSECMERAGHSSVVRAVKSFANRAVGLRLCSLLLRKVSLIWL